MSITALSDAGLVPTEEPFLHRQIAPFSFKCRRFDANLRWIAADLTLFAAGLTPIHRRIAADFNDSRDLFKAETEE